MSDGDVINNVFAKTSERIKIIRKVYCNDSNKEFAKKVGIPENQASNWVSDEYKAGKKVLAKILSVFPDVEPNWLYAGVGKMKKSENTQVIDGDDDLPDDNIDMNGMNMNKLLDYLKFKDTINHQQIIKNQEHISIGQTLLREFISTSHEQMCKGQEHITNGQEILREHINKSHEQLNKGNEQLSMSHEILKVYMIKGQENIDKFFTIIERQNNMFHNISKSKDNMDGYHIGTEELHESKGHDMSNKTLHQFSQPVEA